MLMNDIQSKLLSAFESSGLTYDELAKRTNLPKSALYRYLNGDTEKIPIDRFQAVCNELHVEASTILGWNDESPEIISRDDNYWIDDRNERKLIDTYRSLSPRGKNLLMDRADELMILYGKKSESDSAQSV